MKKKLYRNTEDKMVAGVLSGIADHFDHDVTIWRLAFLVLMVVTVFWPAFFAYIAAWIVVPEKPKIEPVNDSDYKVYE